MLTACHDDGLIKHLCAVQFVILLQVQRLLGSEFLLTRVNPRQKVESFHCVTDASVCGRRLSGCRHTDEQWSGNVRWSSMLRGVPGGIVCHFLAMWNR